MKEKGGRKSGRGNRGKKKEGEISIRSQTILIEAKMQVRFFFFIGA